MFNRKLWVMVMILIFALGVGFSFSSAVEEAFAANCDCRTEEGCPPECNRGGKWNDLYGVCEDVGGVCSLCRCS